MSTAACLDVNPTDSPAPLLDATTQDAQVINHPWRWELSVLCASEETAWGIRRMAEIAGRPIGFRWRRDGQVHVDVSTADPHAMASAAAAIASEHAYQLRAGQDPDRTGIPILPGIHATMPGGATTPGEIDDLHRTVLNVPHEARDRIALVLLAINAGNPVARARAHRDLLLALWPDARPEPSAQPASPCARGIARLLAHGPGDQFVEWDFSALDRRVRGALTNGTLPMTFRWKPWLTDIP